VNCIILIPVYSDYVIKNDLDKNLKILQKLTIANIINENTRLAFSLIISIINVAIFSMFIYKFKSKIDMVKRNYINEDLD
jgi:riboflavin transporter FmnP